MEQQGCPFGNRDIGIGLHVDDLPGCKTRDRHLVEVIFRAAIRELAAFVLLQEERIEPVMVESFLQLPFFIEPCDTYQRMECLKSVVIVKILYCINKYLLHNPLIFQLFIECKFTYFIA